MFTELRPQNSTLRGYRAVGASVGVHLAVLVAVVLHNPRALYVTPTWLASGNGLHDYQITYLAPTNEPSVDDPAKLTLPVQTAHIRPRRTPQVAIPKPVEEKRQPNPQAEVADHSARAGSPLGTVIDGPIVGHEVRVAFPVYPEPQVDRADLPRDLSGDVVIEVTIDAQGNVVETKIVQAIGRGVDEKIEATLRRRRYEPARLDGVPVPSRQDVHFHFPS